MILAFYKVDNSCNYERHTFDNLYDKPQTILEMLSKLKDDEYRAYDTTTATRTRNVDLEDFVEDYNDEELDGGWWCVVIR